MSAKLETQLEEARVSLEKVEREKGAREAESCELRSDLDRANSELEALGAKLIKAREAKEEAARDKERADEEWAGRMAKMDEINSEQAQAFASLKEEFDRVARWGNQRGPLCLYFIYLLIDIVPGNPTSWTKSWRFRRNTTFV